MSPQHRRRGGARLLAALALCGAALTAATGVANPARAAPTDVFVEVNPNTIQAGFQVGIRASCGDNLNPATVHSNVFGTVTLTPQHGFLIAAVAVQPGTRAGSYPVELKCANGATASATLIVISMATPTRGPATGGGGTAGGDPAATLLAGGLAAVVAGAGLLVLRRRRAAASPQPAHHPRLDP